MQRLLNTCRLTLQPVQASDAAEIHVMFAQEGVIRDSEAGFQERGLGLWSARERGTQPIAGLTGFRHFYDLPVLELLYALHPVYWNGGLATDMAQAAVDYAFSHELLTEIHCTQSRLSPRHGASRYAPAWPHHRDRGGRYLLGSASLHPVVR